MPMQIRDDLFSNDRLSGASIGTAVMPGWGTLAGYGVGAVYDQIKDVGLWNSISEPVTWVKDIGKMNIGDIASKFLDPSSLIFGSSNKKKEEPKIAGKTQQEWIDSLGMTEEEYKKNLTQLMQTIATGASESRNKMAEINAYENAPQATRLAAERGVNIRQNEATQSGTVELERIQAEMNKQANQIVMQMFGQKESNDEAYQRMLDQQTTQSMGNLLNLLGQYLGETYFGNNANQAQTVDQVNANAVNTGNYNQYVFQNPNGRNSHPMTNDPYNMLGTDNYNFNY